MAGLHLIGPCDQGPLQLSAQLCVTLLFRLPRSSAVCALDSRCMDECKGQHLPAAYCDRRSECLIRGGAGMCGGRRVADRQGKH